MVSACLLGINCRYDGRHALCPGLVDSLPSFHIIPICPEQLGGLSTPRVPANITGGDGYDVLSGKAEVENSLGEIITGAFISGAKESYRLARLSGASYAIMKDNSPSCGIKTTYCDKPSGLGIGITAALFKSSGIKIFELGSNDVFPIQNFLDLLRTRAKIT